MMMFRICPAGIVICLAVKRRRGWFWRLIAGPLDLTPETDIWRWEP